MALGKHGLLVLSCVLGMGCGAGPVARVVNGRVESGSFVSEGSYADFLTAALAEASSNPRLAMPAPSGVAPTPLAPDAGQDERRTLLALALLEPGATSRWEALAAFGHATGDAPLEVLGLAGVARTAPERRSAIGTVAVDLAGSGRVGSARALAGALLSDQRGPSFASFAASAVVPPLVARLGIDEALLSADRGLIDARSIQAHVALEVVAARAWVLGDVHLATDLVALPRAADPDNLAARLVYEGARGRSASRLLPRERAGRLLAPEVVLPVARDLLQAEGLAAATRVLRWCDLKATAGDTLLEPLAVDLALAGATNESALSGNARTEIAARRGAAPSGELLLDPSMDARHRLLVVSFLRPTDAETQAEAKRLLAAAGVDRVVAVAVTRISLARHEKTPPAARAFLQSAMASDPLAAASLLDVLAVDGPASALEGARRHLAALARTPAERERASPR